MKVKTLLETFNAKELAERLKWFEIEELIACKTIELQISVMLEMIRDGEEVENIKDADDLAFVIMDSCSHRDHPCSSFGKTDFVANIKKYFPNELKKLISLTSS